MKRHILYPTFLFLILTCLPACSSGGGGDEGDDTVNASAIIDTFLRGSTTDSSGLASLSFSLPPETSKLSLTASTTVGGISIVQVSDDRGIDYLFPGGDEISLASSFFPFVNSINIPSREQDPTLEENSTLSATVLVTSSSGGAALANQAVTFTITTNPDNDFGSGRLSVNIFYVGSLAQIAENKEVVRAAIAEMRDIFQDEPNIALNITEFDVAGSNLLPDPSNGSDLYLAASSGAPAPAVNIFVAADIQGAGGALGFSSSIPGPVVPSVRSAVAISLTNGAGIDGIFSDVETRLLGETLAHESGHFMGLFHPVDFEGPLVFASDPLTDTDFCGSESVCLGNEDLVRNLMFSFPVLDSSGEPIAQNRLTGQQSAVLNRYTAVN